MKLKKLNWALLAILTGCATVPKGPSVAVMPGQGKSFESFQSDDGVCKKYAEDSAGSAGEAADSSMAKSIGLGTVLGAAAGVLMGGHQGTGVGAGIGMADGAAIGTNASNRSASGVQRRYDIAYEQCMYAKGHQVPGMRPQVPVYAPPPPPAGN